MTTATPPSEEAGKQPAEFYFAESYHPDESLGYLMRQILILVRQEVDKQLAHSDLTNAQWIPLYKLSLNQASTVAELARMCQLDGGAMTRLLDRMEAKGLCHRERSETDRRVVNISLTDTGREAAQDIPRVLSQVQNAHLAGFTQEEFQTLKGYLRRILANAKNLQPNNTP